MIHLEKDIAQDDPPWTVDPILGSYRFCNVFREDDKVTRWFKDHVREQLRDHDTVVPATIIFRWFNRIETGEVLAKKDLFERWEPRRARNALKKLSPLVTGAYMIKTPALKTKLEGLIWCIGNVWRKRDQLCKDMWAAETLEWAHSRLMQFPYIGSFMAYEIVTDLRHTGCLENATDINQWASAGPGAARGLGRVADFGADYYNYASRKDQAQMQSFMHLILQMSWEGEYWSKLWPRWEMREVEHTLCEFDKYERARLGEGRPKQRYHHARD